MDQLIADLINCYGLDSRLGEVLRAAGWDERVMSHGLEAWYNEDFGHWAFERPSANRGLKTYFRRVLGGQNQVYLINSCK